MTEVQVEKNGHVLLVKSAPGYEFKPIVISEEQAFKLGLVDGGGKIAKGKNAQALAARVVELLVANEFEIEEADDKQTEPDDFRYSLVADDGASFRRWWDLSECDDLSEVIEAFSDDTDSPTLDEWRKVVSRHPRVAWAVKGLATKIEGEVEGLEGDEGDRGARTVLHQESVDALRRFIADSSGDTEAKVLLGRALDSLALEFSAPPEEKANLERARTAREEGLRYFREAASADEDTWARASFTFALWNQAETEHALGNDGAATSLAEESLARARKDGDYDSIILDGLAAWEEKRGNQAKASDHRLERLTRQAAQLAAKPDYGWLVTPIEEALASQIRFAKAGSGMAGVKQTLAKLRESVANAVNATAPSAGTAAIATILMRVAKRVGSTEGGEVTAMLNSEADALRGKK